MELLEDPGRVIMRLAGQRGHLACLRGLKGSSTQGHGPEDAHVQVQRMGLVPSTASGPHHTNRAFKLLAASSDFQQSETMNLRAGAASRATISAAE